MRLKELRRRVRLQGAIDFVVISKALETRDKRLVRWGIEMSIPEGKEWISTEEQVPLPHCMFTYCWHRGDCKVVCGKDIKVRVERSC